MSKLEVNGPGERIKTSTQHLPQTEDIACPHAILFEATVDSKFQKCVPLLLQLSFGSETIVVEGPMSLVPCFFNLSDNILFCLYSFQVLGIPFICILLQGFILLF
jgi:hypothetical protein